MINKKRTKALLKFIIPSLLVGATIASTNSFAISNSSLKLDSTLTKAKSKTTIDTISSFDDYDLIANSNIFAPVVESDGIVGISKDKTILTLTTFDGILVWENKIASNSYIKEFYKKNYPLVQESELSTYVVNNYVYNSSNKTLVVLFGSSNHQNQVVFGLNFQTGTLYEPIANRSSIVKAKNNIKYLYLNSVNDIIGTSGDTYSQYSSTTELYTVNAQKGVSQIEIVTTVPIASSENDYLVSVTKGVYNVNFAIFMSGTKESSSNSWKMYMTTVDDYLSPIHKTGMQINKFEMGDYENISAPTNGEQNINWSDVIRYQSQTIVYNSSDNIFFAVVPGAKSKILKMKYVFNTKEMSSSTNYSFNSHNNSIYTYVYDRKNYMLYISNKKSSDATSVVKMLLKADTWTATTIEKNNDPENYNSTTHIYSNPDLVIPVIPLETLTVPDPFIVLKKNKAPFAKYFISGSQIFTKNIFFKKYNHPLSKLKEREFYKNSLPSAVTTNNLLNELSFTSALDGFEKKIINRTNDDNNGILRFDYQVLYTNWYNSNSKSSFTIPIVLNGMYALNQNFKFSFVTDLTGDTENDDKYKKIKELTSQKYSNQVTKQEVLNNFFIYDVKGIDKNKITLSESNISLSSADAGASLTVTVRFNQANLPNGWKNKTYTQKYTGFKTTYGYEFGMVDQSANITAIKENRYPSEFTFEDLINNFVTLGTKWSKSKSDWRFSITPNNYTGIVYVSLEYIKNDNEFPAGMSKKLLDTALISGFKSIPSQFNTEQNNLTISDYYGEASPSILYDAFLNAPKTSELYNSLSFPYISNNDYLQIEALNKDTMDNDGYIDLSVQMKENAQTTLPVSNVSGNPYFVFNSEAKAAFETYFENGEYPFTVRWNINTIVQDFTWVTNSGVEIGDNSTLNIDLDETSYEGIDKTMYANEVRSESIDKLFKSEYFTAEKELIPNVLKGTLKVKIRLVPKAYSNNSKINTISEIQDIKVINISNFRVPAPVLSKFVPIVISTVLSFTFICMFIAIAVYMSRKGNYKKIQVKEPSKK